VVHTMIDNTRVGCNNPAAFVSAVRRLATACESMNVTVSPVPTSSNGPMSLQEWAARPQSAIVADGSAHATSHVWLGELTERQHNGETTTKNTTDMVDKLNKAFARIVSNRGEEGLVDIAVTRRHVASAIGLITWMASTIGLRMYDLFDVLRLASALGFAASSGGWDAPCGFLSPATFDALATCVATLSANVPAVPTTWHVRRGNIDDYDAIAVVDASGLGWGAVIWSRSAAGWTSMELSEGWHQDVAARHSAHTEPLAARKVFEYIRRTASKTSNIAILTDHRAVAGAQLRRDGYGGYSSSWNLNAFYKTFYQGAGEGRRDIYYIPGDENVADAPSRLIGRSPLFRATAVAMPIPNLYCLWNGEKGPTERGTTERGQPRVYHQPAGIPHID
jgi:hypothetical protein